MKKKHKVDIGRLKAILPYFATGIATLLLVFVGSLDKQNSSTNLSLNTFAESGYKVSVDQLSAMYVVADISDALGLASASDVASNYVLVTSMRDAGQTSLGKLEKPSITNVAVSRGVIRHTVAAGDTMESIAAKYGITTDQIRWSNNKKTTDLNAGDILYIPSTRGIVYTVKSGDTIEGIASKYGSSVAEIIALNDLELSGISEGMRILIKGGELPETERPEYVAPVQTNYYYTYLGGTSMRQNIEVIRYFSCWPNELGGPYVCGQCTQWAWYMREVNGAPIPSTWGNANTWGARAANDGYTVDHNPAPGAIFQSSSGWYGHVGYVEAVNPDGSIVATEMNYSYVPGRAIRSTISASSAASLWYIH